MRRCWLIALDRGRPGAEADLGHDAQRHRAAVRGRHRQVLDGRKIAPRILRQHHADRHLPIGQREFGAVLVDVAHASRCGSSGSAPTWSRPCCAARSSRGVIDDLGPLQVARRRAAPQLRAAAAISLDELWRGLVSCLGSEPVQHDRNVAAGAAAPLLRRGSSRGHRRSCAARGASSRSNSMLVRVRLLAFSVMKIVRHCPRGRSRPRDVDFGCALTQRPRPGRRRVGLLERRARHHLDAAPG